MIETRANFGYMLTGLTMLWSVAPLMALARTGTGKITLVLLVGGALCLGAWTLVRERRLFAIMVTLILIAVLAQIIQLVTDSASARYLTLILQIIFWAMCALFVGRHVLAPGPVNRNRIYAAICLYLVAAVICALVFVLMNEVNPNAFKGLGDVPFEVRFAELMYFSTVTLTTLGYGDVTPVDPYARWLAQVEATFGQLYLAILIATLVGLRISNAGRSD